MTKLIAALALAFTILRFSPVPLLVNLLLAGLIMSIATADVRLEENRDRLRLAEWLKRPRRYAPYRRAMRRLMAGLRRTIRPQSIQDHPAPAVWWRNSEWYLTPRATTRAIAAKSARAPLSWRVLDFSIRLAFIYPIFLAALQWGLTGQSISLGELEFFPKESRLWPRAVMICLIAMVALPRIFILAVPTSLKGVVRQFSGWLAIVALAGAVALAVTIALAGAFAVALAHAVAVRRNHPAIAYSALILLAYSAFFTALALSPVGEGGPNTSLMTFILFLGLLPLTNALFDFLSYGATLAMIRAGLAGAWQPGTAPHRRAGWARALFFVLADLALAIVMFTLLGGALIAVIALANTLAPQPIFPLAPLLGENGDIPLWVIAMLFSTALPTLIHLGLAGVSLSGFAPRNLRTYLARQIALAPDDGRAKIIAPVLLGSLWFFAWVLPLALLGGVGLVLFTQYPLILDTYLQVFSHIAAIFGEVREIGPGYLPRSPIVFFDI